MCLCVAHYDWLQLKILYGDTADNFNIDYELLMGLYHLFQDVSLILVSEWLLFFLY